MGKGRSKDTLREFFDELGERRCNKIRLVSADAAEFIGDVNLLDGKVSEAGEGRCTLAVADAPAPGLRASEVPSGADVPTNHLAYAVQWFLFAAAALIIYALAVRRRLQR